MHADGPGGPEDEIDFGRLVGPARGRGQVGSEPPAAVDPAPVDADVENAQGDARTDPTAAYEPVA